MIVQPSSGFDSIPADLGALFTAGQCLARTGRPCAAVVAAVAMQGKLSGGTLGTGMLMEELGLQPEMDRPFLLGGEHVLEAAGRPADADADGTTAVHLPGLDTWGSPFMMSKINTRVVRRSCGLLEAGGTARAAGYGADFAYQEYQEADSEAAAVRRAKAMLRMPSGA